MLVTCLRVHVLRSVSPFFCRSAHGKGPPYLMVDLCLIARLFRGFLPGLNPPPPPPPSRTLKRPKSAPSIAHRRALACLRRRAPPWTSWGLGYAGWRAVCCAPAAREPLPQLPVRCLSMEPCAGCCCSTRNDSWPAPACRCAGRFRGYGLTSPRPCRGRPCCRLSGRSS